jgi:glutathione S-transferase
MELKFSPLSPYVRKVLVVAHECGVAARIQLGRVNTREEPEKIAPLNPLGKIPALITDDGAVLFDSPVICEYLDAEFGGHRLLPASGARRWEVMTAAALADGILDAAVLVRNERNRPAERQSQEWIAWQLAKVFRGMDAFEARADTFGRELDLAQVGLGCALGYMPLRIDELARLDRWPKLAAWNGKLAERESFRLTAPVM